MKLWPKALVRPIRFHDLRHTTANLLLMAGANPASVQRILRHSDSRITTEVYGHLVPDSRRAEIDRLAFGISPTVSKGLPESKGSPEVAMLPADLATSVLPPAGNRPRNATSDETEARDSERLNLWARRDSNPLPPASEAGTLSR